MGQFIGGNYHSDENTQVITASGQVQRTVTRFINASSGHQGATGTTAVASNDGLAKVAASQSATTFVIPVNSALKIGDTITGFKVVGQVGSAGNTVTMDADLRKETAAAAGCTDASVGAITQVSATANTKVASVKSGLTEVVASETHYYVLVTVTTAASTTAQIAGIELTVNEI